MTLRNLMYATMIACAFASCSKDDVVGPDGPVVAEGDASFAIKIAQPTKAATDADISDLTVLVFNGWQSASTGITLEKKATVDGNVTEVTQTKLTPGNKTVLVLANAKTEVASFTEGATTLQNVLDATTTFQVLSETVGNFSMNSKAYEVTLQASVTNYLGYGLDGQAAGNYLAQAGTEPVKMYRNVAKILLTSIKIKEEVDKGYQYPKATLRVTELFVLHGHNTSKLVGADAAEWGTTNVDGHYVSGVSADTYKEYLKGVNETNKIFSYLADPESNYAHAPELATTIVGADYSPIVVSKDAPYAPKADYKTFYTYENTASTTDEIQTLLVIKGDFSYDGIKPGETEVSRMTEKDRYYSFAIGTTSTIDLKNLDANLIALRGGAENIKGVLRNLQYETSVTIAGPGYKTPFGPKGGDDTFLDVKVKVVDFGRVIQDVEIE